MQYEAARTAIRRGRLAVFEVVLAVVLSGVALTVGVSGARAGTFVADLCQTPGGTPIGSNGLVEEDWGGASRVFHNSACSKAAERITMEVGPDSSGYANGQGGGFTYAAPNNVTISSYVLNMGGVFACGPVTVPCGAGSGDVFVDHAGEQDPDYDFRDLGAGTVYPTTIEATGMHGVDSVLLGASCDGEGGICAASRPIATLEVESGQFTLQDASVPKAEHVYGPQAGPGPVSGEAEWSFTAADSGSGVYRVTALVDGQQLSQHVLDENKGLCVDLEPAQAIRTFASPQPCVTEADGTQTLNTNDLADGEHTVRVFVEDAAGDTANVFDGKLTTENGPILESPPAVSGVAQVGVTLTATNGIFGLRSEQAWAGPVGGQWERCAASSSCQAITGATGTSYVPTPSDVGYELVYKTTATAKVTDNVANGLLHSSVASSAPTLAVTEAQGSSVSCSGGCLTAGSGGSGGEGGDGGNGAGSAGGSGAGSNGGDDGPVTVDLNSLGLTPSGAAGTLGSAASWRVSLNVSPRRVRRHTQIRLTGLVATSPRPSTGKLVYLQARELAVVVRRVRGRAKKVSEYGSWITFMALRAKSNGSYAATYRFRLGGSHTYEFRAVAPAEGQFRNATGTSSSVAVRET